MISRSRSCTAFFHTTTRHTLTTFSLCCIRYINWMYINFSEIKSLITAKCRQNRLKWNLIHTVKLLYFHLCMQTWDQSFGMKLRLGAVKPTNNIYFKHQIYNLLFEWPIRITESLGNRISTSTYYCYYLFVEVCHIPLILWNRELYQCKLPYYRLADHLIITNKVLTNDYRLEMPSLFLKSKLEKLRGCEHFSSKAENRA